MRPEGSGSIRKKMQDLVLLFVILAAMLVVGVGVLLGVYQRHYGKLLHNVTTASEFNQDFKNNIDAKMYYYVINSQYSDGLPVVEVQSAQWLARELLRSTTEKDSLRAATSVLDLCLTLEEKIYEIRDTESYDERNQQLENNIYVITSLIQEYMYDYLYYEAVHLNNLQESMNRQILVEIIAISLFVAGAGLLLIRRTLRLSGQITGPVESLCTRVREIGSGDLSPRQPVESDAEEMQTLSRGLEQMVERMNTLMAETTQKQARLRNAELALLQAQINPHFLYNTLDTIVWLVEAEKNAEAVEMVTNLSGFFRSSLSNGADVVSLETEVAQVQSYLRIQQARYKDILTFRIQVDPAVMDARLPKLTLQPLVENALYHGIKLKRTAGTITVTGGARDGKVYLYVRDDGAGISPGRLEQLQESLAGGRRLGFGLATVHERLQLLFGSGYGLYISSEPGVGTEVCVTIPHGKEEEK